MIFFLLLFLILFMILLLDNKKENFNDKIVLLDNINIIVLKDIHDKQILEMTKKYCKKMVKDCTISFSDNTLKSNSIVNISLDKDLKIKNNNSKKFIVLYSNSNNNSYNKKFKQKWNNNKKNIVFINIDTILLNYKSIVSELESKFKIKLDIDKLIQNNNIINDLMII